MTDTLMLADEVAHIVSSVGAHRQVREPVFAESTLRRIEDWITGFKEYETEVLVRDCLHLSTREILQPLRAELRNKLWTHELLLAGGPAERPRRRMPSMQRIAKHHGLPLPPHCVRCRWVPPAQTWLAAQHYLERAHIIDRVFDGLDIEANLAPLCGPCHRPQPIFRPGDEQIALSWFGLADRRSGTAFGEEAA